MAFTGDPANSATDRIRLIVGDTDNQLEYLTDDVYVYLLTKYNNAETPTALEAARYILGSLAKFSRQRTGEVEIYGAEMFNNYKAFLTELLRNPQMLLDRAAVYAGGLSKKDMRANDCNGDNLPPSFYRGFTEEHRVYDDTQTFY